MKGKGEVGDGEQEELRSRSQGWGSWGAGAHRWPFFPPLSRTSTFQVLADLQTSDHYISGLYSTVQTPFLFLQTPLPPLTPVLQRTPGPTALSLVYLCVAALAAVRHRRRLPGDGGRATPDKPLVEIGLIRHRGRLSSSLIYA